MGKSATTAIFLVDRLSEIDVETVLSHLWIVQTLPLVVTMLTLLLLLALFYHLFQTFNVLVVFFKRI